MRSLTTQELSCQQRAWVRREEDDKDKAGHKGKGDNYGLFVTVPRNCPAVDKRSNDCPNGARLPKTGLPRRWDLPTYVRTIILAVLFLN